MSSKSKKTYNEAYVWIWLPGETKPVVAGKLSPDGENLVFNYGKSYLERENKISIYEPELPLIKGALPLPTGLTVPGCIRDGSPDAWGRRVIINTVTGKTGKDVDGNELSELTYLLESGSDRVGALDFQASPKIYNPRLNKNVSLDELLASAEKVENGESLSDELDLALHQGSAIGGARPKALIEDGKKKYIAKFSSSSDLYSVIKAEFIAMRLAELVDLNVAKVKLTKALHKDVLLVERFDRIHTGNGFERKSFVSALTLFELDERLSHYGSYESLCEIIRKRYAKHKESLQELFSRLVFNVLVGNTDDHARNHAAFWDGEVLSMTPAYDICPQSRTGNVANQAMVISGKDKTSQIESCLMASPNFQLSRETALKITQNLLTGIIENWQAVCKEANVSATDRKYFMDRQFFNPYIFENLKEDGAHLIETAKNFRGQ